MYEVRSWTTSPSTGRAQTFAPKEVFLELAQLRASWTTVPVVMPWG